jgi:rRNA-processing protein FCF1
MLGGDIKQFITSKIIEALRNIRDEEIKEVARQTLILCSQDKELCKKIRKILIILLASIEKYMREQEAE